MSGLPKLNEILSDIKGFSNKELEKPSYDYDISEAASDIFSNADGWFINYNKIKQIIQKCAESYHAKKCAECQKAKDSL